MQIVKTIVTTLNILMVIMFYIFGRSLSWDNEKDHAPIMGFGFMICLHMANMVLIWY